MWYKDFDVWNEVKKKSEETNPIIFFNSREVWWCRLGINLGFEQDGKSTQFSRPVVVLKTYNINTALIVPLTSKDKKGRYYFDIGKINGKEAKAILSQLRFIDKRRFIKKIDVIPAYLKNFK